MYQILQKFDIHWHGGGRSIAMIIIEGSLICSMMEKVAYCVMWKISYYIVPYYLSEMKWFEFEFELGRV